MRAYFNFASVIVSDICGSLVEAELDRIWTSLSSAGYAVTDEKSIGLPPKFRDNFGPTYFNDRVLRHDAGDWPVDRKRARDVIQYWWQGTALRVEEYGKTGITDRAGIAGTREHARVWLLDDPQAKDLVRALLSLVPPDRREATGTFGVNLFRTYTNVVTSPHHDNEEFIILYVVNRIGEGAETYLYRPEDVSADGEPVADPIFRTQLNPGQIIIFEDGKFKHGATPLIPPTGETALRDALVCTVDDRQTYLARARA